MKKGTVEKQSKEWRKNGGTERIIGSSRIGRKKRFEEKKREKLENYFKRRRNSDVKIVKSQGTELKQRH